MGDLDIVLVEKLLEPTVSPGVKHRVGDVVLCVVGGVACRLEFQGGQAGITADGSNQLVASGRLGCGISVGFEPFPEGFISFLKAIGGITGTYFKSVSDHDS